MEKWSDEFMEMLDECLDQDDRLNDAEREVLSMLSSRIRRGGAPSTQQIDYVGRVWDRVVGSTP